jgi:hypothetical protein
MARLSLSPRSHRGATTAEYVVIAGVIVAIVLAVAAIFRSEIASAVELLGCQIGLGAAGGSGGCGGGSGASTAGSAGSSGGGVGGQNPGQPLRPGQLVQTGPPPSNVGAATGTGDRGTGGAATTNPASLAGTGPMAPGGPTVTPGFGTLAGVAGTLSGSSVGTLAGEAVDLGAAAVPNPLPGGSSGLPVVDTFNSTSARYGQWVGGGWSGGSANPDKVGAMPPEDALDALGQAHDFGYAIAEEAGRLYGDAEKYRLMALADEIGYRAWQQLNPDPAKWVPPPKDLAAARTYYQRFPTVMQGMAAAHERSRRNSPPPTPAQLAALQARGPITAADLAGEQRRRVDSWSIDRGTRMRANNGWK